MAVDKPYARTFVKRFTQARSPYLRIGAIAIALLGLIVPSVFFAIEDPAFLLTFLRSMAYALLPFWLVVAALVTLLRARQIQRIVSAAKGGASVTLSEVGISTSTDNSESHAEWSAYDHALRYDDGVMLMRMKNLPMLWLPDSSLVDGSPEEVTSFVAKRLRLNVV